MSILSPIYPISGTKNPLRFMFCALFILLHVFCFSVAAQEVTILTARGDRIVGSLVEYKDGVLKLEAMGETLEIPAEELVLVDFASDQAQVSGEAYLHLLSGEQFLELGMEDEALEAFKAAMRRSPRYADAHLKIGVLLDKRGQKREALQYISRAIKLNPNLPDMAGYFMEVADNYLAAGELEDAAATYHLLYQTYPENEAAEYAAYQAGFLYSEELNNNKKALEILEDALGKFPASGNVEKALYEVGRIREEEGLPESAEGALLQFISEFPASQRISDAHYILGKAYLQTGRNEDAIAEFAEVVNESSDAKLISMANRMLGQCIWFVYNPSGNLPGDSINALVQDGEYLWIGTSDGIVLFNIKENTFADEKLLAGTDIKALAVDDLHLWIGTVGSGLKRYNKLEKTWTSYAENEGLSSDNILAISVDSENVWLGMARSGVYRYDKLNDIWTNYTANDGLPGNSIVSIASTPDGVWCGAWQKGGGFFDPVANRWKSDPEISKEITVTSIAAGANGVWFAWYGIWDDGRPTNGVSRYDASTKEWDHQPLKFEIGEEVVRMINLAANDAEVWVGTDTDEAMLYDYITWRPFNYPPALSGDVIRCVLIVNDNSAYDSVWFGAPHGLGKLDKKLLKRVEYIRKRQKDEMP